MSKKLLLFIVLILAACGRGSDPYETLTSGVEVQALIGPLCPVVKEGVECPDRPYQAMLTILNTDRKEILKFETNTDGKYIVNLPPGDYILHPESPQGMPLPYASEQNFTVLPNTITNLIILYDSGIR